MALPPELQQELKNLAGLPHVAALEEEMNSHANLAAAKAQGGAVGMSSLFNSIMIATETLDDAEKLARAYAKSLHVQKLVQEDKVVLVDWRSIFNNAAQRDMHVNMADNLDRAFNDAQGGVLIISEPYQCPPDMSPRAFAQNNYIATAMLMEKMDEMEGFDDEVNPLIEAGKDLREIEGQIAQQDFENPRKPVVILIGKPFEMESMLAYDPYPWNMRFMHRLGVSEKAAEGKVPAQPAPQHGRKHTP